MTSPTFATSRSILLWITAIGLSMTLCFSLVAHTQAVLWMGSAMVGIGTLGTLLSQPRRQTIAAVLPKQVGRPLLIWVVWVTLSISWSVYPKTSAELIATDVWLPALFFLAGLVITQQKKLLRLCLTGLSIGIIGISVSTLTALYLGRTDILGSGYAPDMAIHPLMRWYSGPGLSSTFIIVTLPLLVWTHVEKLLPRWFCVIAIALMLVCGTVTLNRFFWVSVFAQFALAMLLRLHRRGWRGFISPKALTGLFVIVIVCTGLFFGTITSRPTGYVPSNSNIAEKIEKTFANDPRFQIWQYWIDIARKAPLIGTGFGKETAAGVQIPTHPLYNMMDHSGHTHPHNILLSIAVQTGIIGLLIFSWLMISVAHFGWQMARQERLVRAAGVALVMLVVGVLIKNMTDDFYDKKLAIVFWTYAALLIGHIRHSLNSDQAHKQAF